MNFSYDLIETQIVEALPELRPAADYYARKEGRPGEDSGAYIFFEGMFCTYVEILLAMPDSPTRDLLLSRAFHLVENMLKSSDEAVQGLAYIGMFEGKALWFYSRALKFIGPVSRQELDKNEPRWREVLQHDYAPGPDEEFIDLYCVREVILGQLQSEGVKREDIPGVTYPRELEGFSSLQQAKKNVEGVVFLSCFGTTIPYVICPAKEVACTEEVLWKTARDLAKIDNQQPNQEAKANLMFLRIPMGERVWNMNCGTEKHTRYYGKLWIADKFTQLGLSDSITGILNVKRDSLT